MTIDMWGEVNLLSKFQLPGNEGLLKIFSQRSFGVSREKLDGVGPVDNRPSPD